jgi:cobalamin biosynthetic protein CobC
VSPEAVAAWVYGCTGPVVALAGAQAAIQLVPRLSAADRAAVLAPNYNQRATALTAQGWEVDATADLNAMVGADLAVVVNPNNPDGRRWPVWWERSAIGIRSGSPQTSARVRALPGPWAVGGPAIAMGTAALAAVDWCHAMRKQLHADATRAVHIAGCKR